MKSLDQSTARLVLEALAYLRSAREALDNTGNVDSDKLDRAARHTSAAVELLESFTVNDINTGE